MTRTLPTPAMLATLIVTEASEVLEPGAVVDEPVVGADAAVAAGALVPADVDGLLEEAHAASIRDAPVATRIGTVSARCRMKLTNEAIGALSGSGRPANQNPAPPELGAAVVGVPDDGCVFWLGAFWAGAFCV